MDEDTPANMEDNEQLLIDIANIKNEINESGYVENPNMRFTVRVEVEEYNEDVKHNIKIEMHDIAEYTAKEEKETIPSHRVIKRNNNIVKKIKPKEQVKSIAIDLNKLYDEADKIASTSDNIADHILARELKNNWGSVLRKPVDNDPINLRLQDIIHKWKVWSNASKYRDVPLSYKCYLCQEAWWRLEPFRVHLKTHDIDSFRLELEECLHEANIIAYGTVNIPKLKYLKTKEDCWRCNKPFEHHIATKKQHATYYCKCCDERFYTCTNLKAHEGVCWQYLKHIEVERGQEMAMCPLCQCMFATTPELDRHMTSFHSVRSDQPMQSPYKVCSSCNLRYFIHALHCCNKKLMSYNCDGCLKGFATKLTLDVHLLSTENDVKCQLCPEILEKKCTEILHYQKHSSMFKMGYKCATCVEPQVFLEEYSARLHRTYAHNQKKDKRRNHIEKVLLPISYFLKDYLTTEQRQTAGTDNEENDEPDFPVFAAKDVRKTYQAKTKAQTEDQEGAKVPVTRIKQEIPDPEFEERELVQNLDNSNISTSSGYIQAVCEDFIPPEHIKTEIKSEPIDEYETVIMAIDSNDIKEEITIGPETIYKEVHTTSADVAKYPCSRCNKNFYTAKKYLLHFVVHGVPYMSCPICLIPFGNMTRLLPHITHHVKQTYVKLKVIEECPKRDRRRKNSKHQCKLCRSMVESFNLFGHWDTHFKTGWKKQEEEEGVANVALQSEGLKMILQDLLENDKEMKKKDCVICFRHFERKNDCKRHLIEHLLTDAYCNRPAYGALRCQVCQEGFQRPDRYKLHMRDHGSLPVYRCDICDRAFSDSSNFTKHKKVHNLQVVVCDICNKKFQSKVSLIKHLEMHKTTEPIKCQICFRVVHTESAYKRHVRRFHDKVMMRYKCPYCGKKFDSVKDKWDHLWLVHKERKQKADCPVCKHQFRKAQDLKTHMMRVHALILRRSAKKTDDIEEFLRDNPPLIEEEVIVYE